MRQPLFLLNIFSILLRFTVEWRILQLQLKIYQLEITWSCCSPVGFNHTSLRVLHCKIPEQRCGTYAPPLFL